MKVGEGWIQVDDRNMLGELVLGSSSEKLRKVKATLIVYSYLIFFSFRSFCFPFEVFVVGVSEV